MVIFGASGDLTRRLLVPALYNLARTGLIPEHFAIIGVDIAERSAEDWRDSLRAMLQSFVGNPNSENRIDAIDEAVWQRLAGAMSYVQGDFSDRDLFEKLRLHLQRRRARAADRRQLPVLSSPWPTASSVRSSNSSAMPACWTRSCATASRSAGGAW